EAIVAGCLELRFAESVSRASFEEIARLLFEMAQVGVGRQGVGRGIGSGHSMASFQSLPGVRCVGPKEGIGLANKDRWASTLPADGARPVRLRSIRLWRGRLLRKGEGKIFSRLVDSAA